MSLIRSALKAAVLTVAGEPAHAAAPANPPPPPPAAAPPPANHTPPATEPQPAALPTLDAAGDDAAFIVELAAIKVERKKLELREQAVQKHLLERVLALGAGELRTPVASLVFVPGTQRIEAARPSKVIEVAPRVALKLPTPAAEPLTPRAA